MTTPTNQLKPCPFCGREAAENDYNCDVPDMSDCGYSAIECVPCGISFEFYDDDSREAAIARWNTRKEQA